MAQNNQLLPTTAQEFADAKYWQDFFKKRGESAFEWYGEYAQLCGIIHKYIKPKDNVLMIGCGNSDLSANLYDVGIQNIMNIDISDLVIKNMRTKNEKREKMKFVKMDVTQLSFEDESYSVVLDKGTLDALFTDTNDNTVEVIEKMYNEIVRVLKLGGRYICISLAQDHIVKNIVSFFHSKNWPVRICRIETSENDTFGLPVFAFVFTKFKMMNNLKTPLEFSSFCDSIQRFDSPENLIEQVKQLQYYAFLIKKAENSDEIADEHVSIKLHNQAHQEPRYTIHLVINSEFTKGLSMGVFIVPRGREIEWVFSTFEGRKLLAKNANCRRLLVVSMSRKHEYGGMDSIKAELSSKVMDLAPHGIKDKDVPFLTLGDNIDCRTIRYEFNSKLSGTGFVEDVSCSGDNYRRIIFETSPNMIQSEAKLVYKNVSRKKKELVIDKSSLTCSYHQFMVAGLIFIENFQQVYKKSAERDIPTLVVGFGGGSLTLFLHTFFKKLLVLAVEIDETLLEIALKWFAFPKDECQVIIDDGVHQVEVLAEKGEKRMVIMLDADAKDISQGMTAPPEQFIEENFLKKLYNILHEEGVIIMNMACRNKDLKIEVLSKLKKQFPSVFTVPIDQEINEIIYCKKQKCQFSEEYCKKELAALNSILLETPAKNNLSVSQLPNTLVAV